MNQATALILIAVNLFAGFAILFWYLLDRYTKRIENLISTSNKPSCAFIQAQQKKSAKGNQ